MRFPLILLLAMSLVAEPRLFDMKPSPANAFELYIHKTGFLSGKVHRFVFDQYEGEIKLDVANPENATVELTVQSASAMCRDAWLSAKDQKKVLEFAKDMLDAERYPTIRFVSSSIRKLPADVFEVQGNLTIRDITKPVTVNVKMLPQPDGSMKFEGSSKFKMTSLGLKPPSAALGTIGTKDEMMFEFKQIAVPSK
jgi:polyisoprenoid-binding protein YceI